MKKVLIVFLLIFSVSFLKGQDKIPITESDYSNDKVEMADQFRKEGKIYVVVGIIGVIMAGFLIYVVGIDRKLTKLEKQQRTD